MVAWRFCEEQQGRGHSEGCRKRLEEEMKAEAKVGEAKRRRAEFTKEAIEMEDRKWSRGSEAAARGIGITDEERKK